MTRVEEMFNHEMEHANWMKGTCNAEYWGGYSAAVMRVFFGNNAVADHHHETWLRSDKNGEEAKGYREGYCKLARVRYDVSSAESNGSLETRSLEAWENEGGATERFRVRKTAITSPAGTVPGRPSPD